MRFDSRPTDYPDFRELIKAALARYEDVQDEQFILIAENVDPTITATEVSLQYHRHTLVPIGANFQAVIPPMLTE